MKSNTVSEVLRIKAVEFAKKYPELTLGQMLILAEFGEEIAYSCMSLCDHESMSAIEEEFKLQEWGDDDDDES
jgi:hypothetical protein